MYNFVVWYDLSFLSDILIKDSEKNKDSFFISYNHLGIHIRKSGLPDLMFFLSVNIFSDLKKKTRNHLWYKKWLFFQNDVAIKSDPFFRKTLSVQCMSAYVPLHNAKTIFIKCTRLELILDSSYHVVGYYYVTKRCTKCITLVEWHKK